MFVTYMVQNMAYKVFLLIKRGEFVKELGENLSFLRRENGVTISEASHDLGINEKEIECIENGNFKVFKDVYELKKVITSYAKYLGMDEKIIQDEFNEYLFEKTSKISKDDIKKALKNEEPKEEKVSSPYTKVVKSRYDFAPIVLLIVLLVFISLVVYLLLNNIRGDDKVTKELLGKGDMLELTE